MKKGIENRVIALDALTPHNRNYNRHSAGQIADLRESLKQFGQVRSIVVQADKAGKRFTIVAGHGIAEAARAEGYTELRADVIPHNWSETRVLAYLAADNELARRGDPDTDQLAAIVREVMEAEGDALARLAAGEQAALDAILNAGNATEETADVGELVDKAAELQKKWQVQRGDVWEIGKHRLMCGDSTSAEDVAMLMQGETVETLVSDPPYGIGYEYASHDDSSNEENENLVRRAFDFAPTARVWTCGLMNLARDLAWNPTARVLVWHKKFAAAGNGLGGASTWEPVLVANIKGGTLPNDYLEFMTDRIEGLRDLHTCPKPIGLFHHLITHLAGKSIYEPFSGSGTTLIACEQTGRIGRGMEIEPKYCAVTLERMSLLGLTPRRVESIGNGKQAKKLGENTDQKARASTNKSRVIGESRAAIS